MLWHSVDRQQPKPMLNGTAASALVQKNAQKSWEIEINSFKAIDKITQ
jgi:hypothetical protein